MKLEATDRRFPYFVCVATIMDRTGMQAVFPSFSVCALSYMKYSDQETHKAIQVNSPKTVISKLSQVGLNPMSRDSLHSWQMLYQLGQIKQHNLTVKSQRQKKCLNLKTRQNVHLRASYSNCLGWCLHRQILACL